METTQVTLEIASIRRVPAFWSRRRLDDPTTRNYAHSLLDGVTLPPVLVAMIKGVPTLVDGHHRLAAAQDNGAETIQALTFEASADQAAIVAAMANLGHGLALDGLERRCAMEKAIRAGWQRQSNGTTLPLAAVAQAFGVGAVDALRWIKRRAPKIYRADFAPPSRPRRPRRHRSRSGTPSRWP